jgi:hypothetical protein
MRAAKVFVSWTRTWSGNLKRPMYRAMSQNLLVPYAPKIFHDKSMNED